MNLTAIIRKKLTSERTTTLQSVQWLQQHMSPYFFQAMSDEEDAVALLAREMASLKLNQRVILVDREKLLVLASVNRHGSLYETLQRIGEREISYAMFSHSNAPMPGMDVELEVQRFEFDRQHNHAIDLTREITIPVALVRKVRAELRCSFPGFDLHKMDKFLKILWLNNQNYIRMSPPTRIAWLVWLFERGNASGGQFLDVAQVDRDGLPETRVLFAVGNPPQSDFLLQLLEVFNRLDIGIRRAYCLTISNGIHPYFLGAFFVKSRRGEDLSTGSDLVLRLTAELCTTQILATSSTIYRDFVTEGLMTGEDATLVNAFISFCHTSLAHCQPDRFGLDGVQKAFYDHPEMSQLLIKLFRTRFDPHVEGRDELYRAVLAEAREAVEFYNTGHRWLDDIRRIG